MKRKFRVAAARAQRAQEGRCPVHGYQMHEADICEAGPADLGRAKHPKLSALLNELYAELKGEWAFFIYAMRERAFFLKCPRRGCAITALADARNGGPLYDVRDGDDVFSV